MAEGGVLSAVWEAFKGVAHGFFAGASSGISAAVAAVSPSSRKRRAPDSNSSSEVASESERDAPAADAPTGNAPAASARRNFAETVAARRSNLPQHFRGEPNSKRRRHSVAWSSSPALHTDLATPAPSLHAAAFAASPSARLRAASWRDSLPPRAPRFSGGGRLSLTPRTPAARAPAARPSFLRPPRVPIPPAAPRGLQSPFARFVQGSHTQKYMRRYRHRASSPGRVAKTRRTLDTAVRSRAAIGALSRFATEENLEPARAHGLPMPKARTAPRPNGGPPPNGHAPATRKPPTMPTSTLTPAGSAFTANRKVSKPVAAGSKRVVSEQRLSDIDSNVDSNVDSSMPAAELPGKTLDIAKRAGLTREELCDIYTPELVDVMENNPLFADKLLKKHGAEMSTELLYSARSNDRKWRITNAEEDLQKIRAQSHLYTSIDNHLQNVRKATESAFADTIDGRIEKPPGDGEARWTKPYFVELDDVFVEDADSTAERKAGRTVMNEKSAFSPLTDFAQKRLSQTANDASNAQRVLVNINGCRVTGDDLALLQPRTWLNDEVVNGYMELLVRRSQKMAEQSDNHLKIRAASSFFYAKLLEENRQTGQPEYDYSKVRRWTRRFDVFAHDVFIVPINQHNMHWTLGVVNFREKRIEHYDSFGGGGSAAILENLLRWVADESEHKKQTELDVGEWSKVAMTRQLPQQDNSDDCGVFVCKFADFLSRGAKITFKARHMNYFRARIAHELLAERAA